MSCDLRACLYVWVNWLCLSRRMNGAVVYGRLPESSGSMCQPHDIDITSSYSMPPTSAGDNWSMPLCQQRVKTEPEVVPLQQRHMVNHVTALNVCQCYRVYNAALCYCSAKLLWLVLTSIGRAMCLSKHSLCEYTSLGDRNAHTVSHAWIGSSRSVSFILFWSLWKWNTRCFFW